MLVNILELAMFMLGKASSPCFYRWTETLECLFLDKLYRSARFKSRPTGWKATLEYLPCARHLIHIA